MSTITTRENQRHTASAARRVGGYAELVRLSDMGGRSGERRVVTRNAETGRWDVRLEPQS